MTEEIVFRSCIVAVSALAGFSKAQIVFLSPLYFGIGAKLCVEKGETELTVFNAAHVHHAWETYVKGGRTRQALVQGVLQSSESLPLQCLLVGDGAEGRSDDTKLTSPPQPSNSCSRPSSGGTRPSSSCEVVRPIFFSPLLANPAQDLSSPPSSRTPSATSWASHRSDGLCRRFRRRRSVSSPSISEQRCFRDQ